MAFTQEEIEIIKETNICDNIPLRWAIHTEGIVDGVEVNEKSWRATCAVCKATFVKTYEEPPAEEPPVVNLD